MSDTPYELDLPVIAGNLNKTLANLIALRAELASQPLKPHYRVHGHDFDWPGLYKFLSDEIDRVAKQINSFDCFEIVSIARP